MSIKQVGQIEVQLLEYTNTDFPSWVRCFFCDAYGEEIYFVEKLPIVSAISSIILPARGQLRGAIVGEFANIITFDTAEPDGVESENGESRFYVLSENVTRLK